MMPRWRRSAMAQTCICMASSFRRARILARARKSPRCCGHDCRGHCRITWCRRELCSSPLCHAWHPARSIGARCWAMPAESHIRPARPEWQRPAAMALDRDGPIAVPYAAPPPDFTERSIHALFEAMVARAPDAIALCDRASRLTFAEVHAQVIALARRIADCVPRSAAVGILLPTSVQVPIAMLASLVAGRTCLAFDDHQPTERI